MRLACLVAVAAVSLPVVVLRPVSQAVVVLRLVSQAVDVQWIVAVLQAAAVQAFAIASALVALLARLLSAAVPLAAAKHLAVVRRLVSLPAVALRPVSQAAVVPLLHVAAKLPAVAK
ncbi:hypothetical protein [Adhaeretor mobilis]|uniref:hypothetical protein n=1 Tax=Adhaeretor mobilis TaxID=1930276 RepID=UPI0011A17219|nr:hypothetical protein [Adhaeretor mobilis]